MFYKEMHKFDQARHRTFNKYERNMGNRGEETWAGFGGQRRYSM